MNRLPDRLHVPTYVRPMMATLIDQPFDRDGWLFEIKWDGYRAIAEVGARSVRLYSRSRQSFASTYALIVESLRRLGHRAILDGEIVVLDKNGHAKFELLQKYQKQHVGTLVYYVFDLLALDGRDLRTLPLRRRREMLAKILPDLPNVRLSEHVDKRGRALFAAVQARGLEGIIAKNAASPYCEGRRSRAWLKIKSLQQQEAVIGGFTEPRGSRRGIGALVLGVYEDGALTYIGHTAGRLGAEELLAMRARLLPLVQAECPFRRRPATNAPVHWVRPSLVCAVRFQEWTSDGIMRQPIFLGLREDRNARSVRREIAAPGALAAQR